MQSPFLLGTVNKMTTSKSVLSLLDDKFSNCANLLQPLLLLAFRLNWGWQFFETGKGKLVNHADVTNFFSSLHLPLPGLSAWMVGGLECFGGLLLLIGVFSRPAAFLLGGVMLGAYLSVEDDRVKLLSMFKDPTPFLNADPFFFLLTAALVLAFGPGMLSLDAALKRLLAKKLDSSSLRTGAEEFKMLDTAPSVRYNISVGK